MVEILMTHIVTYTKEDIEQLIKDDLKSKGLRIANLNWPGQYETWAEVKVVPWEISPITDNNEDWVRVKRKKVVTKPSEKPLHDGYQPNSNEQKTPIKPPSKPPKPVNES
jgi:hypothetical protein